MHTHQYLLLSTRVEYYKLLGTVDVQLRKRFEQSGLETLEQLEKVVLTGNTDDVVDQYPELNKKKLEIELAMFTSKYTYKSSTEAAQRLRDMLPEVRGLSDQVESLMRFLLIVPTSSAEAERNFSALRRLKSWLRSTMKKKRLNNVAVCHIYQDQLDNMNRRALCQQFIDANDRRKNVFRSFFKYNRSSYQLVSG